MQAPDPGWESWVQLSAKSLAPLAPPPLSPENADFRNLSTQS